jgi:putative flippase GtrA
MPIMVAYVIAWFFTVLFAYLTNRVWVFDSQAHGFRELLNEAVKFYVARIATGLIGMAILWFGTSLLHQNDMLWNIIQNVFVVVSNYVLSKLIIFKAKEKWER